jgi:hypothetical protein
MNNENKGEFDFVGFVMAMLVVGMLWFGGIWFTVKVLKYFSLI